MKLLCTVEHVPYRVLNVVDGCRKRPLGSQAILDVEDRIACFGGDEAAKPVVGAMQR